MSVFIVRQSDSQDYATGNLQQAKGMANVFAERHKVPYDVVEFVETAKPLRTVGDVPVNGFFRYDNVTYRKTSAILSSITGDRMACVDVTGEIKNFLANTPVDEFEEAKFGALLPGQQFFFEGRRYAKLARHPAVPKLSSNKLDAGVHTALLVVIASLSIAAGMLLNEALTPDPRPLPPDIDLIREGTDVEQQHFMYGLSYTGFYKTLYAKQLPKGKWHIVARKDK